MGESDDEPIGGQVNPPFTFDIYFFTTMPELILKLKKDHQAGRPVNGRSYNKSSLVIVNGKQVKDIANAVQEMN